MTEFNILSKSDWKQLVLKELKGQSFDSLKWTINDRINIDPYYTKEDAVSHLSILPVGNEWLIGESFDLTTPEESNNLLLESLSGGLQSPLFILADSFKQEELSIILKNVELSYLTPFWDLSKFTVASEIVSFLEVITEQSKQENNDLKGGLILNPIHLLEQFNTISIQFPALKIIAVHYVINEIQEVDSSLATMLLNVKELMEKLNPTDRVSFFSKCFFTFQIDKNYFFEIAKLRALSYLWANFQLAYGVTNPEVPFLNIEFDTKAYDEESNTNMIRATTMTMAAMLGGGSRITVLPADEANAFTRRIARNIQHLLNMESGFDKVQDPTAGTYYIDQLTLKIAESAWSIFIKRTID